MAAEPEERIRDWRRPSCDARCVLVSAIKPGLLGRVAIESHDPEAHEQYGRLTAGPLGETAVVWTGSLVVDRWRRTVVSDGRPVAVARREWEILEYLAARTGRFCRSTEIAAAIWGAGESDRRLVRVTLCRLRARLGANRRLIENRVDHGYRLRTEPPIEGVAPVPEGTPVGRWAPDHDRCRCCGTTDPGHTMRGDAAPAASARTRGRRAARIR